jgi:hypothetical protein
MEHECAGERDYEMWVKDERDREDTSYEKNSITLARHIQRTVSEERGLFKVPRSLIFVLPLGEGLEDEVHEHAGAQPRRRVVVVLGGDDVVVVRGPGEVEDLVQTFAADRELVRATWGGRVCAERG